MAWAELILGWGVWRCLRPIRLSPTLSAFNNLSLWDWVIQQHSSMKKIQLLPLTALLFCVLSCENPKPKFKTGDDPHIDSLMTKIKTNQKVQFDEIDRKLEAHSKPQMQYLFVRLAVTENKITQIQESNIVSQIQELDRIDDEVKARIEDQVIGEYLNSSSAKVYKGKIVRKETFVFNSYVEASEKRNSFLISEN